MANKKIKSLEAELAQFREKVDSQSQAHEERLDDLGSQLSKVLAILTTVSTKLADDETLSDMRSGRQERPKDNETETTPPRNNEARVTKVKMPIFEGNDAYGWIYRMERYFEVQGIRATDQLHTAGLCMEGVALSWFRWSHQRKPFRSWEDIKPRLLDRFRGGAEGDIYEQFLSLKQEGTAREYINAFERLSGQLTDLPEQVLESTFLKGLKPELRLLLRVMKPPDLLQAMQMVLTVEENQPFGKSSAQPPPLRQLLRVETTKPAASCSHHTHWRDT